MVAVQAAYMRNTACACCVVSMRRQLQQLPADTDSYSRLQPPLQAAQMSSAFAALLYRPPSYCKCTSLPVPSTMQFPHISSLQNLHMLT